MDIELEATYCHELFVFCKKRGSRWSVWHEEAGEYTIEDCNNTFYDEDELPAPMVAVRANPRQTSSEEASYSTTQRCSTVEKATRRAILARKRDAEMWRA